MNRSRVSFFRRLLFTLVVTIAALAFLEAIVRLSGIDTYFQSRSFTVNRSLDYPDVFLKDHDLFWRLRPGRTVTSKFFEGRTYHINSLGLRGGAINRVKTGTRIIALGNSCTFGWGVTDDETYIRRLGELLGAGFEVINGAVPGYTSFQGMKFFESDLIKLNPDIVLILFGWNDHWAAAGEIADKEQHFPSPPIIALQNFASQFHLYRLMKRLLLSPIERHPDSLFDPKSPVYRVSLGDYYMNLSSICRTARSRGIRPILLTAPIPSLKTYYPAGAKSNLHVYHEAYNEIVRRLARAEQIDLVDVAGQFDRYTGLYDDGPRDPIHFNAQGHRLIAELVAARLKQTEPASAVGR